jgi:hypothetical protein
MDCSFVLDHLFSYQEKILSGAEIKEFEDHLHSCDNCTRIAAQFENIVTFIDKKKFEEPNPFIKGRTIQRIETELERTKKSPMLQFQKRLQPVIISFLLFMAIVIGYSIGRLIEAGYSSEIAHQNEIQSVKSNLNIKDFIDEDNIFFINH